MSDKSKETSQASAAGADQAQVTEQATTLGHLGGAEMQNRVVSVRWNTSAPTGEQTFLSGTLTVAVALSARFGGFVIAGVNFSVQNASVGSTSVNFTYSGAQSASAVRSLLVAGAQVVFFGG